MLLDSHINFNEHVQSKINKCYKIIWLIKKLSIHLPIEALLRIYKSFVRPNLDYGDIIFDKTKDVRELIFLIKLIINHLKVESKVFRIKHV